MKKALLEKIIIPFGICFILLSNFNCYKSQSVADTPFSQEEVRKQKEMKLGCSVKVDKIFNQDHTINIVFEINNLTKKPITLNFSSGKQFDIFITNSSNKNIWQLSAHLFYTMALTSLELGPGESKIYKAKWEQKEDQGLLVPAGEYKIEAFLTNIESDIQCKSSTTVVI
ncbi:MAG: BsuPI-related putative proteinase inhibitor [bacterium]